MTDEISDIERRLIEAQRRGKRTFQAVLGAGALAALVVTGWIYQREIARALEPSPAPWSAAEHDAPMRAWMSEHLPAYVVVAGRDDEGKRAHVAAELIETAAFHHGLRRRAEAITDAIEEWHAYTKRRIRPKPERSQDKASEVAMEVEALEEMLREMDAPFVVDNDIGLVRDDKGFWNLRFVATTAEVLGRTRFSDGTKEHSTLRIRRLDGLNVLDLVHGKARNGFAYVLEEGPTKTVYNRYLPALREGGTLRPLFEPDASDEAKVMAAGLRPRLIEVLPEELRARAGWIGEVAEQRRVVLEQLSDVYAQWNIRLLEPEAFFLPAEWYLRVERRLGRGRYPELLDALKRFTVHTDLSDDDQAVILNAGAALLDRVMLGVERHEAWHITVPEPPPLKGLPPRVSHEVVAYLGSLADAQDELPFVYDHIFALHRRASADDAGQTATNLAITTIGRELLILSDTDASLSREQRARQKARQLLKSWFNEERSLSVLERASPEEKR